MRPKTLADRIADALYEERDAIRRAYEEEMERKREKRLNPMRNYDSVDWAMAKRYGEILAARLEAQS